MKSLSRLVFCLVLLATSPLFSKQGQQKPKIGLVLSGGGAKGLAHVGVLKVLEKAGIKVDIITGTSIGALVGALYAAGYTPAELEKLITNRNWVDLLLDRFSRREIRMNDKDSNSRYLISLNFKKGKLAPPAGISRGQRITSLFSRLTWPLHDISDFTRLPIPFACIATDLQRGEPVILNRGFLPMAMRASMSIPSFFTPVEYDNRLLVDGGSMENFPVSLAKKMGADIIIGVDVSDSPKSKEELKNIAEIISQIAMYRNQSNLVKQRALCNILIRPDISKYRTSSFQASEKLLKIGETAARKQLKTLQQLAARTGARPRRRGHSAIYRAARSAFLVEKISIIGVKPDRARQLKRVLQIEAGSQITADELESRINTLYTSGIFHHILFRILPAKKGKQIIIHIREEGKRQLRFGLRYDLDNRAQLLFNHTVKNILGQWSVLDIAAELGRNLKLATELLFDISFLPWLQSGAALKYEHWEINRYLNGKLNSNYDYDFGDVSFFLQSLNSRKMRLRLSLGKEFALIRPNFSNQYTEKQFHDFLVFSLSLNIDSTDSNDFPTRGITLLSRFGVITPLLAFDSGELEKPIFRALGDLRFFIPFSTRFVFSGELTCGISDGKTIPDDYFFYFGGRRLTRGMVFPFPGLRSMEIPTRNAVSAIASLRAEPWRNIFISIFSGYLRYGPTFRDIFQNTRSIFGWGGEIGIRTPIGPIRIAVTGADAQGSSPLFHLEAGHQF